MYIAGAGTGKTTFILNDVYRQREQSHSSPKILIITYTTKNQDNIKNRIIEKYGFLPSDIIVIGWYSFLLDYWIKPFKGSVIDELYNNHILLSFVEGKSGIVKQNGHSYYTYKNNDLKKKFFTDQYGIYSDKISEFAYLCFNKNNENLLIRLSNIFHSVYIDEVQDLSAWDYDIIKILLRNTKSTTYTLCGDPRQCTYTTSNSSKWSSYKGRLDIFLEQKVNTSKKTYVIIDKTTLNMSHRSISQICQFASKIMPEYPIIQTCTCDECLIRRNTYKKTTGIFFIQRQDVDKFIAEFSPMILRWDSRTDVQRNNTCQLYTYGEAKGLESDSCLIYPTQTILKDYFMNNNELSSLTKCKLYVAVTRSRYITAFVIDDNTKNYAIKLPYLYQ